MIEHDLDYPVKRKLDCTHCREELYHHRVGKGVDGIQGIEVTVIIMRCRLCENTVSIPATYMDTGGLTRFLVKR